MHAADATSPRTGAILVTAAAAAFSTAGLFTRLIAADVWTVLFWRGLFGAVLIAAYIVWTLRGGVLRAFTMLSGAAIAAAACSTIGTICFVNALRMTTVADVTVIFSTSPFIAACIAWIWYRERQTRTTLAASALALAGVVVMFSASRPRVNLIGCALALAMTVLISLMMVIIRRHRRVSMLPAVCLSALACAVLVAPWSHPLNVTPRDFLLLAAFGTTQFGLGLLLLAVGGRLISATRASLLGTLELPLAPIWVWLAFAEFPPYETIAGGGVVLAAILLDLGAHRNAVA